MKKLLITLILVLALAISASAHVTEHGLVAVKVDGGVFLSWSAYEGDTVYELSRDGEVILTSPVTNFIDKDGTIDSTYSINGEKAVKVLENQYLEIPISIPATTADGITYSANDASIGDLDGDGEYEIVLKWDPSDSKDAATAGQTERAYIDAYEFDGTLMWRIDLGKNIRAGAHDTQFLVYDFDGDGCDEVAFRTADGTIDGLGNAIGDKDAVWYDNWSGKNLEGPLFITVFEGKSGKALATTKYDPQNDEPSTIIFGDNYGNRSERYVAAVAYLDGETPSMVFVRGYYHGREGKGPGRTVVAAFDYKNGEITKKWRFDTLDEGNEIYIGQGNHNMSVGDVDGDGCDEIFLGSLTLDNDGSVLWCSFMGHGDAMHLGDFDPTRGGLEFFEVHESQTAAQKYGYTVFDAATGEVLLFSEGGKDTGRGMIGNIGDFGGSYVAWAGSGTVKKNSLGEDLNLPFNSMNFRIYWDGDLYDELLDGITVFKVNETGSQDVLLSAEGCASNNSTKANPCLSADIFGDWREEVIWRTADSTALRIYTTTIPTDYRVDTLMSDHIYRMGIVWQNAAYNQPPHLGYYLRDNLKNEITMTVGSQLAYAGGAGVFLDTPPTIVNSRTLIPLRFVSEALGAKVGWDGESKTVTIIIANKIIEMKIGQDCFTLDGEEIALDTPPEIINERTMIPIRAFCEALGKEVNWDGATKRITIK